MTRATARLALLVVLLAAGLAAAPRATERASREDLSALPPEERKWLTEFVAPIILPEERKVFLTLTEAYQRESYAEVQKLWAKEHGLSDRATLEDITKTYHGPSPDAWADWWNS